MIAQQLLKKYHRSFRRYWIAGLSFLTIITIEGFLMYLLTDRQINAEREIVGKLAVVQGELLQRQLDQSLSVPLTLALILRHNQGTLKNFEDLAADLIKSYPGISHLKLAPEGIVREIYPPGEHDQEIGVNLLKDEANSSHLFRSIASRKMKVTLPMELDGGMMKIVGYLPVFVEQDTDAETFWGFVIIEIQIAHLLEQSRLNQIVEQDYAYQLEWVDPESGDRRVFARSQNADLVEPITYRINVANGAWILALSPADVWGYKTSLLLESTFILVIGLAIAYLVFQLLKQPEILQQQVELRVADLSNINQQLTTEIRERQRIEQALRDSEERFRAIANATPIPLVISRFSDGLVLYGNDYTCQIFNLLPEKLIGCQTPDYYYNQSDRQHLLETLKINGNINNYEFQVKKKMERRFGWRYILD